MGAIARVKPGDGRSIPVDKALGDEAFAGTINQSGSLEFEVTKPATDTVLARMPYAASRIMLPTGLESRIDRVEEVGVVGE